MCVHVIASLVHVCIYFFVRACMHAFSMLEGRRACVCAGTLHLDSMDGKMMCSVSAAAPAIADVDAGGMLLLVSCPEEGSAAPVGKAATMGVRGAAYTLQQHRNDHPALLH